MSWPSVPRFGMYSLMILHDVHRVISLFSCASRLSSNHRPLITISTHASYHMTFPG